MILKLKGIDTPEQAESLRNCYIKINRKDARKYRGKRRKQLCIVLFKITDIKMDR